MEDERVRYLSDRMNWFVRLRWVAAGGVFATIFFTNRIIKVPLLTQRLYSIAFFLVGYNACLCLILAWRKRKNLLTFSWANILANVQISLDLMCLAMLIHFSGGVENPFISYFIFHMIIASILLSRRAAFLQATYAVLLFFCIVVLEYAGFLPHYYLWSEGRHSLSHNLVYVNGIFFAFSSTLYIAVYMASSISARLKEREKKLEEANASLEEKDNIKSRYVLRVTHDIKEDLSAIHSCIEPVTEEITGTLNDSQKNLLERAKFRSGKLIFYVNALLEITKIKLSRNLDRESFSFLELIKSVSEHIEPLAKAKGVELRVNSELYACEFKGVRTYIHEAIINLLANSLKYTPGGGQIDIALKRRKNVLFIKISDTGIGIPEKELSHIFEEFYRASNARKMEKQGTGLGLAIAKQIVEEMHRGKICVESKEGKGTAFYIELPI